MDAGEADAAGTYPPDTINGKVAARLAELRAVARDYFGLSRTDT
jgi:hypothetical protein